jgi:molybdopterin converting factor small subunit
MISLTENDVTLATLLDTLVEKYPTLKPLLQIALVAVNMSYVDDDCKDVLLHPGDEIAIIPPVSGG